MAGIQVSRADLDDVAGTLGGSTAPHALLSEIVDTIRQAIDDDVEQVTVTVELGEPSTVAQFEAAFVADEPAVPGVVVTVVKIGR